MSARVYQRSSHRVGILLLLGFIAACDNGLVEIKPLPAAGGNPDAGLLAEAGVGGSRLGSGGPSEPRGGAGRSSRPPDANPCDEGTELQQAQERELREAFSEAFESGKYCPNLSSEQRRPLVLDRDLEWRARGFICVTAGTLNWFPLLRSPVWAWVLWDAPSLEDAKRALLDGDHAKLCEEAERLPFRYVAVGHLDEIWTVFLSPGSPEDMQNP